jgi:hypothetical protein
VGEGFIIIVVLVSAVHPASIIVLSVSKLQALRKNAACSFRISRRGISADGNFC